MTNENPFSTGTDMGGDGIFQLPEKWVLSVPFPHTVKIFSGKKESPGGFENHWGMKIIKQIGKQGSRCLIRLSQQEWKEIGKDTGWAEEVDRTNRFKPTDHPEVPDPSLDLESMDVTVEKYSDRTFAVYVNGDLLCVTAYRKGANAVKELLERMWQENDILKEKVKAENGAGQNGAGVKSDQGIRDHETPSETSAVS